MKMSLCVLRATSQVLLFPVHCQVRALQMELNTESRMFKENKSSTEVESFKELNLSYTIINLYIPGMTNTQQHPAAMPMVWGVFPAAGTTLTWESAPGVPGLALGPQLN